MSTIPAGGGGVKGVGDGMDRCFPLNCNRSTNQELLLLDRRPVNENRKNNKPLLEKKRRARINRSLDQLKNLLMDVIKNDATTSYSKLEKADILEMTVKHLRQIQTRQLTASISPSSIDPHPTSSVQLHRNNNNYQTGFNECAQEVNRFLLSIDSLQPEVRLRLMNHLAECITAPPQPIHSSAISRINTPQQCRDMLCVIDRLPVTCSTVIHPLTTSQMSPVAMEQLRFRDVIGRATSAFDVIPLSENGCAFSSAPALRVNGVAAHAHRVRDEGVAEGGIEMLRYSSMDEEMRMEENEVLTSPPPSSPPTPPTPPLSVVRGKWRPLVERNNNWQNISLNAPTTAISTFNNNGVNYSHQNLLGDNEDDDYCSPRRLELLPVLRADHFDAKEEPVWRPW